MAPGASAQLQQSRSIDIATTPAARPSAGATPHAVARSRPPARSRNSKAQLRKLAADVLSGEVDRGAAVAVNQIFNSLARPIELERRIREQEMLEERVSALEAVLKLRGAR